ncbi:MAG: class II SORL domain-containing protein [Bacillota bacterium]
MTSLGSYLQTADWKLEKHMPVIELQGAPKKGEAFAVHLSVGAEIPHPHTTEHHIRYIKLYFKPAGEKFVVHLGTYQFEAHGESVEGANKGSARCEPSVTTSIIVDKPGTLAALSYCNLHGLWENSLEINPA